MSKKCFGYVTGFRVKYEIDCLGFCYDFGETVSFGHKTVKTLVT